MFFSYVYSLCKVIFCFLLIKCYFVFALSLQFFIYDIYMNCLHCHITENNPLCLFSFVSFSPFAPSSHHLFFPYANQHICSRQTFIFVLKKQAECFIFYLLLFFHSFSIFSPQNRMGYFSIFCIKNVRNVKNSSFNVKNNQFKVFFATF